MVRVKIPYGRITPEQLEVLGYIAETTRAGWGHLTTRQNVQFHFVQLEQTPEGPAAPRRRRADDPRSVRRHGAQRRGLPPRRRVPVRGPRHHAVGRGDRRLLPAPPVRAAPPPQVQDQLLGLRDRLRPGDVQRRRRRRGEPPAARRHASKPASACSSPAASAPTRTPRRRSKSSPPRKTCCPRSKRAAHVRPLRQPRQQAARPHEVARRHDGASTSCAQRILKERKFLRGRARWPGGIPEHVRERGDAPAGVGTATPPMVGADVAGAAALERHVRAVGRSQRRARRRPRHGERVRVVRARRHHRRAVPCASPTSSATSASTSASRTGRTSCCATSPKPTCAPLYDRLDARSAWPSPAPSSPATSSSCPGADTCNLAVTQSRGLAGDDRRRARRSGPRRRRRRAASTSPAARTSAASTTSPTSASSASNAARTAAPRPATRCCSAATSATWRSEFGEKATKLPAKNAAEAVVRVVGRFADERDAGETFQTWLGRAGGASGSASN